MIVCGWYTPDYAPWATKLIASLEALNIQHDIVEIPPLNGSWEDKTLAKPQQILNAMQRHPKEIIIFLDVDCEVKSDLTPLTKINADIGFYARAKYRKNGNAKFALRSGTLVIKPTTAAREFIEAWIAASKSTVYGSVDQDSQMMAMSVSPNTSFTIIPQKYCATLSDKVSNPVVLHDSASKGVRKISQMRRRAWNLWGWVVRRRRDV